MVLPDCVVLATFANESTSKCGQELPCEIVEVDILTQREQTINIGLFG